MNDYEVGRLAVHEVLGTVANQSHPYRGGFKALMDRRGGIGTLFVPVLDTKSLDEGDADPEDFQYGLEDARATLRWLDRQSEQFRAGWDFELKRPAVERAERLDTEARVERRAAAIVQETKHFEAEVVHAMGRGPKPRSKRLDALEIARIEKLADARDIKRHADRIVQAHHAAKGEAEYVILTSDGGTTPARPDVIAARIRDARAEIVNGKDATWPDLEFRDGPAGRH